MATDRVGTPEILLYRITCTAETDDWAPDAFPCVLVLPDEPDPRSEGRRKWEALRTQPGRWYRFRSLNRPQRVPLTAEQAEWFRGTGWIVEDPRPPEGAAERAAVDHRRARFAEREQRANSREAVLAAYRDSVTASEEERVSHLWDVRLRRKIPRELSPEVWREVQADYLVAWCRINELQHQRAAPEDCTWTPKPGLDGPDGYCPDLDVVRAVVFGWADGRAAEALERAVTHWREKLKPELEALSPVTDGGWWGPAVLRYVTEDFPRMRSEVEQALADWPDSPPALATLLADFQPIADLLGMLEKHLATGLMAAIATRDDLAALSRLTSRREEFAGLLTEAGDDLKRMGWVLAKGRLKRANPRKTGPKPGYLGKVILGLYTYLRPIYERTFRPTGFKWHDGLLRTQISSLLSPFFHKREISSLSDGPIANAIDNHVRALRRNSNRRSKEDAVDPAGPR